MSIYLHSCHLLANLTSEHSPTISLNSLLTFFAFLTFYNICVSAELWAVVNNAGVAVFCEIEWCSVHEFQKIMDVNVFGIVRVTKGFLPLLRQSEGRVINVASLAGKCCILQSE